ncbi:hypothetical protein WJX73_002246 [Symbiochloris irregularis]|uniref:Uncharacterized protein n=1 Tax=Symbiochloris irregularis TaxID=706552 RepID=A0AAW1PNZ4_9CHLO
MARPLLKDRFPPEHFMPSENWQDVSPPDGRFQLSRLSNVVSYWDPEDATSAAKRQQLADRLQNFAKDWLHNTLVLPQFAGRVPSGNRPDNVFVMFRLRPGGNLQIEALKLARGEV